jgi:PAS domain S-box-containing protein
MMMNPTSANAGRESLILLHAPIGRDARLLHDLLRRAQIDSVICKSIEALCHEVQSGAGAVFVAEEALDPRALEYLSTALREQGSWSDLPLIVLTIRGEPTLATRDRLAELGRLGDLSLLERPLRSDTIISVARSALRARAKQYDVRARDAELQLVADNVPVLISYIDPAQNYRRVNQTYFEWFGKRPEQVVGNSVRELVGEPHYSIAAPYILRALGGEPVSFESQLRDKSSELREIAVSYSPDIAPDGSVRGFFSLVQDITERKHSERKQALLLRLGEQQRSVADSMVIKRLASETLGQYLKTDRVGFFELHGDLLSFIGGWANGSLPLLAGTWPISIFGAHTIDRLQADEAVSIDDARENSLVANAQAVTEGAVAVVRAPIVRRGQLRAGMYVDEAEPRSWRQEDIEFITEVAEQTWDAVERARALSALRASEGRFRFLARLDDATRTLNDPQEITLTAARFLAEHLDVNRCAYAEVEEDENTFNLIGDHNREVPSIVGRYKFSDFGDDCLSRMRAGLPYVVSDSESDSRTNAVRDAFRKTCIRSVICVPLRKGIRFVAALAVHQNTPREWHSDDVELVQQVANRCWESIERTRVTRALQEREQRFRFLAESIPQIVWTAGRDGSIKYINGRGASFFSATAEGMVGGRWLERVHPEDRTETDSLWSRSVDTLEPYEMFLRLRRGGDGSWRWHLVRALPLMSESANGAQWFGTFTDIHDQKAVEAELTRTNRELEEFAYVSSHDLQEPLRMVNTYTQLFLKRIGPQGDPELEQYAEYVRTGVRRMETLLKDLLTYSRVGHQEFSEDGATADLQVALQLAIADLGTTLKDTETELSVEPLPIVFGEQSQLSHVFQNLLSNAIKYRTPAEPPHIRIAAKHTENQWVISVADNGIGFEQHHAERIFGLFKRLHRQKEYPGTGLGLAICKRIVERYGGRIWAESQPGAGSTFSFMLPEARLG